MSKKALFSIRHAKLLFNFVFFLKKLIVCENEDQFYH